MPDQPGNSATKVLARDHRTVEAMFARYESTSGTTAKVKIADEICAELKIHARMEEELFYPAMRGQIHDAMLAKAYGEHEEALQLVEEIAGGGADEAFYDARVRMLRQRIEQHIAEEEKKANNMFEQARASGVDLTALGEQLLALRAKLKQQTDAGALPPPEPDMIVF